MMRYSPHIQALLAIWLALWLLILLLYATLFAWYAWPATHRAYCRARTALYRHLHCPWCWRALHLMRWYPPRWSSSMCAHHQRQERARLAARRARRGAASRPQVPTRRAEEVPV